MHTFINSPWHIGSLQLPHRLIQGPLAGYSCAPFRELFYQFTPPAFCVSEMCSAVDVLQKHTPNSRYMYRSPQETLLSYQISGNDAGILAEAALYLEKQGANVIDINCGCPKAKIRKKGAGSALLDEPQKLVMIIKRIKQSISIPLTVKIRIQGIDKDQAIAKMIADAGADALIVHGRRWTDDYDVPNDLQQIAQIKKSIEIPVIANGDITDAASLKRAFAISQCDGFMIGRAGTGKPWLYQELLDDNPGDISLLRRVSLFMLHLQGLAHLENEFKAVLQSKSLVRYYFRHELDAQQLNYFYELDCLSSIEDTLRKNLL